MAIRFLLLLLSLALSLSATESEAAPEIEFAGLVWYADPTGKGQPGWTIGRDDIPLFPERMGRIQEKPLLGHQQIVWKNQAHDITTVTKREDEWWVFFPGGLLVAKHLGGRSWDCQFTAPGDSLPTRFRTARNVP